MICEEIDHLDRITQNLPVENIGSPAYIRKPKGYVRRAEDDIGVPDDVRKNDAGNLNVTGVARGNEKLARRATLAQNFGCCARNDREVIRTERPR
jgi:hypothetical protein